MTGACEDPVYIKIHL